jgi:tRNA/tmRNA/rRNA uracil-C5-methylase (TrmA/RlmC/RlmD family)
MSDEKVTEEDCFNVYWNGEGAMPPHLCLGDFARELSIARANLLDVSTKAEDRATEHRKEYCQVVSENIGHRQRIAELERERDEARKALARFPTLIEITGALVPGANPGLTARLIADYNSAEIARTAGGGGDE